MFRKNWPRFWQRSEAPEKSPASTRRHAQRRPRYRLEVERLEDRTLLAGNSLGDGLATAMPINPTDVVAESLATPAEVDFFQLDFTESGRLTVRTQAAAGSLDTRTTLLGPDGGLLIQSEGQSSADPDDLIIQHVLAGTYYVRVEGPGGGTDSYTLATEFLPAVPPFRPLPVGASTESALVTGDFNGDSIRDLVTVAPALPNVSLFLGLGDGTFRPQQQLFEIGERHLSLTEGDFNGDGRPDLALGHRVEPLVTVVLGRGDGTFQEPMRFAVGDTVFSVETADFNGDGYLDLATANYVSDDISILLGRGDGTFRDQLRIPVAGGPNWLLVGDFNGDGRPDLASENFDSDDVSILLGRGDGTFETEMRFAVGDGPFGGDVGDFNGDGFLDLAVANDGSTADVSVLLGRGDGTFQNERRLFVGDSPISVSAGDFNADGRFDFAVANYNDLAVFLGRGDGTFADPARYAAGLVASAVVASDFNGDGRLDLAATGAGSLDMSILIGRGDGTFLSQGRVADTAITWTSAAGDFNGDGRLDLATTTSNFDGVAVCLGLGDGTFQPPVLFASNTFPRGIIASDFNGDGRTDLATTSNITNDVMIHLGRGDGTFQPGPRLALDRSFNRFLDVLTADFNADGRRDLAVVNEDSGTISVLLGRGDGTFHDAVSYAVGKALDLDTGDFNSDGHLDLVAAAFRASEIVVLLGRGDGTFHEPARFSASGAPQWLAAADFNGDGRLDLAAANGQIHFTLGIVRGGEVSVLLGRGDGTFQDNVRVASGFSPLLPVAGDFNGDGRQDLAVNDFDTGELSVLLGRGDGTFQDRVRYEVGAMPFGPFAGDFNGDGRDDFAFTILDDGNSVLLGEPDGTFRGPTRFEIGTSITSTSLAAGDFNSDGRMDVATSLVNSNKAAIFLGRGDGAFQDATPVATGTAPVSVQTGDFNGDGRLDLATANYGSGDVTVSLGLGDGTYRDAVRFGVGARPVSLVVGDFNGDGRLDLATANSGSDDVSVLLGLGNGSFRGEVRLAVGASPIFLMASDINGDGRLDLATANYVSGDVSLLFARADGTFGAEVRVKVGTAPVAIGVGDFNRDGRRDLAIAHHTSDEVSVLLGRADGTFQNSGRFAVGRLPRSLAVDDFDRDGILDLATANNNSDDVSVLLGRGDGTFQAQVRYAVARYPFAILATDINGDGRVDLATANQLVTETTVLLGLGDGTFVTPETVGNAIHSTPIVADLDGDGIADVAVVNQAGDILLRRGRRDTPGAFEPPVILNSGADAARDVALLATPGRLIVAALDAQSPSVTLYTRGSNGVFTRSAGPTMPAGTLPVDLAAADLNGDGRGDLVVAAAGSREVFVYLQRPTGGFGSAPDYRLNVGPSPSAIELPDVNGDGLRDIVVTNRFSGDVSILLNDRIDPFSSGLRFRAGTGLYYLDEQSVAQSGAPVVRAGEATAGLVAGNFDADSFMELVAVNSGSNTFAVLEGNGAGGFLNPLPAQTFATGLRPTVAVAGRFNDDAHLDLAILNEGSADVSIYLGDGLGGFTEQARTSAGNLPTGLSVHDVDGDGRLDLLVGNQFGDLLVLPGNGDGTFQPYQRVGRGITLAVADLNADGRDDFIFANEALDRVSVEYGAAGKSVFQDRQDGLLAPGAIGTADLNRDGLADLVVANSGANNVIVYLGRINGQFAQGRSFFAGTQPAALTLQDLNGDRLLDLVVANEGSNDVTILLGQGVGAGWTLTDGPRLRAGQGPVSTTVADVTGDRIPDLLVTNGQSNTVSLLRGLGGGFFNDQSAVSFVTGLSPRQSFVGNFDRAPGLDLVTINAGSNDLSFFSGFGAGRRFGSGGDTPLAGASGDFNGDGFSDLLVANNGDGVVSLLVGDAGGLALARTFTHADLLHPTALALATGDGVVDVYVTAEGRESAIHLTSFGIPVPVAGAAEPSLADILLVNGPGFAVALDILVLAATPESLAGERAELGLARANVLAFESLLFDDEAQDESTNADPEAASERTAFMIGVDDAIRQSVASALASSSEAFEAAADVVLAAVDQIFNSWSTVGAWLAAMHQPQAVNGNQSQPEVQSPGGESPTSDEPWKAAERPVLDSSVRKSIDQLLESPPKSGVHEPGSTPARDFLFSILNDGVPMVASAAVESRRPIIDPLLAALCLGVGVQAAWIGWALYSPKRAKTVPWRARSPLGTRPLP